MPPAAANNSPDVMLLIGQLLEAAKAAGEGLKSTNVEMQANAKALIAAVKTLELVEETVADLDRVVRTGNGDAIITRLAILRTEVDDMQSTVGELETRVHAVSVEVGTVAKAHDRLAAGKNVLWEAAKVVGFVITTGIALYAAIWGKS